MSLFRAETRRLAKRRFTRWLLVGVLLVLAAIAVGTAFVNEKVGPAQIAAAEARAEENFRENLRYAEQERQRCEADPSLYNGDCSNVFTPTREDFRTEDYMTSTFTFREKFGDMITALAYILAFAAFVLGASYVGAEWTSGGMMNLLLWRPRRLQVLGTKLAAFLVTLAGLTVVLSAAWTGVFVLIATLRGTMAKMTAGAWQSVALTELRGLGLVLLAGAIGFGLAAVGRHTVGALGVAAGVVVVFQVGLVTVLSLAQVPFFEAWLAPTWINAWMYKTITLEDYNSCDFSATAGCQPEQLTLTWPMAGGLMAFALVVAVGTAMWTMRSRDIT